MTWNALTLKYEEEFDTSPILLTPQQYVKQLKLGSDQWYEESENKSGRIILVDDAIKWTLISRDNSTVTLQKRTGEIRRLSAEDFVKNFSYDHKV